MLLRTFVCCALSVTTNMLAVALYAQAPPFPHKPWWAVLFLVQTGLMYVGLIWMRNTD